MSDRADYEIAVLAARYAVRPSRAVWAAHALLYSVVAVLMLWLPLADTLAAALRGEPVLPALKFNFKCLWLAYVSIIA